MQSSELRSRAAFLWRRIIQTDPNRLFDKDSRWLLNRTGTEDSLAQPGFIGFDYKPGGLVFISMNPGKGGDGNGPDDLKQYQVLRSLRDAQDSDIDSEFEKFTSVVSGVMANWRITLNLVRPILGYAGLQDLSSVAYINLLKWRTKSSSKLTRLYARSWEDHTRDQIDLLHPSIVVALGKSAGDHFKCHGSTEKPTFTIRRLFSNLRPNDGDGAADLKSIERWFAVNHSLEQRNDS